MMLLRYELESSCLDPKKLICVYVRTSHKSVINRMKSVYHGDSKGSFLNAKVNSLVKLVTTRGKTCIVVQFSLFDEGKV
jgi:hypothetical protein